MPNHISLKNPQGLVYRITVQSSYYCLYLFSCLFNHFFILCRRVSGIQQLTEWTDILSHIELHSSASSDNNSFEPKPHLKDELKANKDMAKVLKKTLNFIKF